MSRLYLAKRVVKHIGLIRFNSRSLNIDEIDIRKIGTEIIIIRTHKEEGAVVYESGFVADEDFDLDVYINSKHACGYVTLFEN